MEINLDVPPPYAIQMEPAEGCNLACSFCGIQSIRNNGADAELGMHGKNSAPYRFMTLETNERIAEQVAHYKWNPRIEYAMHGEPTMNTQLTEMIATMRKHNPKVYIMVTSNGGGLVKNAHNRIAGMFEAGLNTLALDDYKHSNGLMQRVLDQLDHDLAPWRVHLYPQDPEGNPHHRHNKRKLVIINDISDNSTGNHQLTNQGGASFASKLEPLAQRCAKPFRELSVRWDGSVAVCCDDWKGSYKVGNTNKESLSDLWYSERFEAARRKLYASDRNFGPSGPCTGCDVRTYRNGLLPDKLGKSEMLPEDDETRAVAKQAMRGKVFTIMLGKGD